MKQDFFGNLVVSKAPFGSNVKPDILEPFEWKTIIQTDTDP